MIQPKKSINLSIKYFCNPINLSPHPLNSIYHTPIVVVPDDLIANVADHKHENVLQNTLLIRNTEILIVEKLALEESQ